MAGRGRGMTLPAWMTKGTASIGKPPAGSSATTPQPGASDKAAQSQAKRAEKPAPQAIPGPPPVRYPMPTPQTSSSVWTEHKAQDGRTYWYNTVTRASSWDKPAELMNAVEKAEAATPWKEFKAPDGRVYYHNKLTKKTTWDLPEELKKARSLAAALAGASSAAAPSKPPPSLAPAVKSAVSAPGPEQENGNNASGSKSGTAQRAVVVEKPALPDFVPKTVKEDYPTKAEAKAAFMELLQDASIAPDFTWEKCMTRIAVDARYGALSSLGEKKQCFHEYLDKKRIQIKEENRVREKRAKDEFVRMLEENTDLTSNMRYLKAIPLISGDPRFDAVTKDRVREELFVDYMKDLAKKEKARERQQRQEAMDDFEGLLRESDFITVRSHWRKVHEKLEADPRAQRLSKSDRLEVFETYMRLLERQEKEMRAAEREKQRRTERKARDLFRDLLQTWVSDGRLTARTRWKDFLAEIKDNEVYRAAAASTSGSTPRELFSDAQDDLLEKVADDKDKVKAYLHEKNLEVTVDTTQEAFVDMLSDELKALSEVHLGFIFADLVERAQERVEKAQRKKRRMEEDFKSLLFATKQVDIDTSFETASKLLEDAEEFKALEAPDRERIYADFMSDLHKKREELLEKKETLDDYRSDRRRDRSRDRERDRHRDRDRDRRDRKDRKRDRSNDEDDDRRRRKEKKHRKRSHHGEDSDDSEDERDRKRRKEHKRRKKERREERDSDSDGERRRHKRSKRTEEGDVSEDGEVR